ncbi:MAG: ribonuclease H-like YkuK family protein [Candidatus Kerfeldbacteria bacterium]|nr:ribonuclease H-like YkuK family protein [Candidatus Kerfeldbacteria bacterium]
MALIADHFHSPTLGNIDTRGLVARMHQFVTADQQSQYRLIIGTDSLPNLDGCVYLVTAIVLHRLGHGGIYFWQRALSQRLHSLRDRMYAEALSSIAMAQALEGMPALQPLLRQNIEIHVDIGQAGPTREMIQELVGMIVAHGYLAKTKPESFAASKVADRHTLPGPALSPQPVVIE